MLIKNSTLNNHYSNNLIPLTTFGVVAGAHIAGALMVDIRNSKFNGNNWINMPNGNTILSALSFYPTSSNVEIKNSQFNQNFIRNGPAIFRIISIFGNNYEVYDSQLENSSSDATAGGGNVGIFTSSEVPSNSLNFIFKNVVVSDLTGNFPTAFEILFSDNVS